MVDVNALKLMGSRLFYAKKMLADLVVEGREHSEIDLTPIKEVGKQFKILEEQLMLLFNDDNEWICSYNAVNIDKFLE